jgi:hypothetical protein
MMNFYIRKGSELPLLKMQLVNDGRNDYRAFHEKIQNADITFTMVYEKDDTKKISCRPCQIVKKLSDCGEIIPEEYYIVYKWRTVDTNKSGRFTGYFNIEFLDGTGTLKVPIREELKINIID